MVLLSLLTRLRQLCCDPVLCYEDYTGGSAKLDSCLELLREARRRWAQGPALFPVHLHARHSGGAPAAGGDQLLYPAGLHLQGKAGTLVESFNRDATQVFLISLKAGGTGLNLTGADVVIHYDPLVEPLRPGTGDRPGPPHRAEKQRTGLQADCQGYHRGKDPAAAGEQKGAGRRRDPAGRFPVLPVSGTACRTAGVTGK